MAERKPITRSFPPDPRSMPNGQVFLRPPPPHPAASQRVRAATSSDQMLVAQPVTLFKADNSDASGGSNL